MLLGNKFKDYSRNWRKGFQSMASPQGHMLVGFYHYAMTYCACIAGFTFYWLYLVRGGSKEKMYFKRKFNRDAYLEIGYSVTPIIILLCICLPGLNLLYLLDNYIHPLLTIRAIGHQWYWEYEVGNPEKSINWGGNSKLKPTIGGESVNAYMTAIEDLKVGQLGMLECEYKLHLPIGTQMVMKVLSADVIHCWTVNSFGVKCDAVPGHTNQLGFWIRRHGNFFGMCSEICGVLHSFMPVQGYGLNLETWAVMPGI